MRLFTKVLAFLSVGFVLVFFGKISKVNLYHAIFKQLEEIQVRNSVGMDQHSAVFGSDLEVQAKPAGLQAFSGFQFSLIPSAFQVFFGISERLPALSSLPEFAPSSFFHLLSSPTRAP